MNTKIWLGVIVVLLLLLCATPIEARSSLYYDIVNDFNAGKNYFKIMGVDKDTPDNEIRKQFRSLSVQKHPDKVGKQGEQEYQDLVRAYDVLRDEEARKEFENLLANGVPWQDQYYGRYAHKYGVPDADVRVVLLGMLTFASVAQYLNQWRKHVFYHEAAKKTPRYQQALKVLQHEKKVRKAQQKKKGIVEDSDSEDDAPPVIVHGAEKPEIKHVILVQMVLSPYYITLALYRIAKWAAQGFPELEVDEEELKRKKMGMTEEEWEEEKLKEEERKEKLMDSNRYKRYRRWMRKNG